MNLKLFQILDRGILRYPRVLYGVISVLTVLAIVAISGVHLGTDLGELILGEDAGFQLYQERVRDFGVGEVVLLSVTIPSTAEGGVPVLERRLRTARDTLVSLPEVAAVRSLLDLGPLLAPTLAQLQSLPADSPLIGTVLSRDRRNAALIVELQASTGIDIEKTPRLMKKIIRGAQSGGFEKIRCVGLLPILADIDAQTRWTLFTITPIVLLVLLGSIYFWFRSWIPVLLTLLVGSLATLWTLGLALWIDPQFNILLGLVPPLTFLIAFADVIHVYTAFRVSPAPTARQAAVETTSEVGRACLLTSVTSLIGFVSLTFLNIPAFQRVGWLLGLGVTLALLLTLSLVPVLLARTPRSAQHDGWQPLEGLLRWCERSALGRPRSIVVVFSLAIVLSLWCASKISIETDFIRRVPEEHPLRQDLSFFNENFSGGNLMDVFLSVEDVTATPRDPRLHPQFDEFVTSVEQLDSVRKVLSLPISISTLFHEESATLRVPILLATTGVHETYLVGESVRELGKSTFDGTLSAEPSGFYYLAGDWLQRNLHAPWQALLTCFLTITVVMMWACRSIRGGLVTMLPNVAPLLFLGAVLGTFWGRVDSDLVMLALISIGIAVDDTLHFCNRWYFESRRVTDSDLALRATLRFSGRAIVLTSVIAASSFLPFALSSYLPFYCVGLLLPWVMLVAVAADLLLLPALIHLGWISFTKGEG